MKDNDKLNIDISGIVNGAVINNGTVNTTVTNKENKSSFYQEWWFISFLVGLISFGLTMWIFKLFLLSIFTGIVTFIIMIMFNPKRRYFRIALSTLFLAIQQFSSFSGVITVPENDFIHGFITINNHTVPWLGILLILLSTFLFILDYKLNKESN
jgi:hypothetical protein